MRKSSVELHTKDSMLIMLTFLRTRMICLFRPSTIWTLDGRQILASSKSTIQIMDLIVQLNQLFWPKFKPNRTLIKKKRYSKSILTSKRHGLRLESSARSTLMLIPSQIASSPRTSTGETSRELILPASTEIKATVVLAILSRSLKSLR